MQLKAGKYLKVKELLSGYSNAGRQRRGGVLSNPVNGPKPGSLAPAYRAENGSVSTRPLTMGEEESVRGEQRCVPGSRLGQ
jgi:hypothetical protein